MDKPRIGFVGVGGMGQMAHLVNYANEAGCEVVAIAELKENQGKLVAEHYRIPKVYKTAEEMLANEELDGDRGEPAVYAARRAAAGAVQGEASRVHGEAAGRERGGRGSILKALKDSGTWHMVGYHKRSDPATMYAKAEIDSAQGIRRARQAAVRSDTDAGGRLGGQWVHRYDRSDDAVPELKWDPPASDMDEETYKAYVCVRQLLHPSGQPDAAPAWRAVSRDLCRAVRRAVCGRKRQRGRVRDRDVAVSHDHRLAGVGAGGVRARVREDRASRAAGAETGRARSRSTRTRAGA